MVLWTTHVLARFLGLERTPSVDPVMKPLCCGSYSAFAFVGNAESTRYLSGHELRMLSEQQVVSCDTHGRGCVCSDMQAAFDYVTSEAGVGVVTVSVHLYYESTWCGAHLIRRGGTHTVRYLCTRCHSCKDSRHLCPLQPVGTTHRGS